MRYTFSKLICILLALAMLGPVSGYVPARDAGGDAGAAVTEDAPPPPEDPVQPADGSVPAGEMVPAEGAQSESVIPAAGTGDLPTGEGAPPVIDEEAPASPAPEETPAPAAGDGEDLPAGYGVGEQLQATYQADHIFSINSMAGESFNPYTTSSAWNRVASMLVYDSLVEADSSFEAQPGLVTRWESQDGMTWTFYVDTSRAFHDGGVMTAGDAVYSLDCARSEYGGRYAKRFAHVRTDYATATESFVVELDQPNWRFYTLLNIPCIESGSLDSSQPPGTGPYRFNSKGTSLVRFKDHPLASQMPLKTIHLKRYTAPEDILQAFEDSLLDLVTNNPADMSSLGYSSANLIKYVDTTNLHYLGYNTRNGLFSQPLYRALITYAIDRDSIISTSFQGSAVAATLPIHPSSSLYPGSLARSLAYSEENLEVALQNCGAQDIDMDGVLDFGQMRGELIFLVCSDSAAKVAAARQVATQLRNAGFAVTMSELEYEDYIKALEEGAFDLYYAEVKICNDWDVTQLVAANGELNYGGGGDPTLEGYIQNFIGSGPDTLQTAAETLYTYFAQNAPITAICFERTQVLYHRGALTTIDPTQDNYFNDIQDWSVDLGSDE